MAEQRCRCDAMAAHPCRLFFAHLDPRRGKPNQRAKEISGEALATTGMPKGFPSLVRFPVITVVEKIDAEQIGLALLPLFGIERSGSIRLGAKTMSRRIPVGCGNCPGTKA